MGVYLKNKQALVGGTQTKSLVIDREKLKSREAQTTMALFLVLGFYLYKLGVISMAPYSIWIAVLGFMLVTHHRHVSGLDAKHVRKLRQKKDVEVIIIVSIIAILTGLLLYAKNVIFLLPFALALEITFIFIWAVLGVSTAEHPMQCKTELVIIASTLTGVAGIWYYRLGNTTPSYRVGLLVFTMLALWYFIEFLTTKIK